MSEVVTRQIEEYNSKHGGRLGRHVEHDPQSRSYAWSVTKAPTELKTVDHMRHGGPFDQGDLGSCTGNAAAGTQNTEPFLKQSTKLLVETDAVSIYEAATKLDDIPGSYPPDDTGSSGLAVAKVLKQRGMITSYKHAFSVEAALDALQVRPGIMGIDWYEGFDKPDAQGLVKISGQVRGGHEIEVTEFHLDSRDLGSSLIGIWNSWGSGWGLNGKFYMTVDTMSKLLEQQGDYTILIRS